MEMIREIVRRYLPAPLLALLRATRRPAGAAAAAQPPEWSVVVEGWAENDPRGQGWLHDSIVAASVARWPLFMRTVEGAGPLGVDREAHDISDQNRVAHGLITAFSYVLARAAHHKDDLSVLDWGGGLGNYSRIARAALPDMNFRYTVHDLPPFCEEGRKLFPKVAFEPDKAVVLDRRYDVVFASSSVQYLRIWRDEVARIARCADSWLFITRLAFVRSVPSFVVVQRPQAYGYRTEYLSWIFNRGEFVRHIEGCGFVLEQEFLVEEQPVIAGAAEQCEERGLLFRRQPIKGADLAVS